MEPSWNPRGTLPQGHPGPPRSRSGLRPQSFQMLGKNRGTENHPTAFHCRSVCCTLSVVSKPQRPYKWFYPAPSPPPPRIAKQQMGMGIPAQQSVHASPTPKLQFRKTPLMPQTHPWKASPNKNKKEATRWESAVVRFTRNASAKQAGSDRMCGASGGNRPRSAPAPDA